MDHNGRDPRQRLWGAAAGKSAGVFRKAEDIKVEYGGVNRCTLERRLHTARLIIFGGSVSGRRLEALLPLTVIVLVLSYHGGGGAVVAGGGGDDGVQVCRAGWVFFG